MTNRTKASRQFLRKLSQIGIGLLNRIITTDETWFHYYDPKQSNNQVNGKISTLLGQKKQVTKSLGKYMFILFMDRKGTILTHTVPRGQTVNADYYCKVCKITIKYISNILP